MPVWAYSLRMSITSGPMLPEYTGMSTLGAPLLNDRVALLSASFMVEVSSKIPVLTHFGSGSKHVQDFTHLIGADLGLQLLAAQQQVHEIVVGQVHQHIHAAGLAYRQARFMPVEKAFDEKIVFEKTAPASPAQLAQGPFTQGSMAIRAGQRRVFGHGQDGHQTARRTISPLSLPIALVGFRPLGQTSTQFMMVWQRNRR